MWLQGATEAETVMKKESKKGHHLFDKKKGFCLFVLLSSYGVFLIGSDLLELLYFRPMIFIVDLARPQIG